MDLLPLAFTRPVAEFRVGITTIREKWEGLLGAECALLPVDYLRDKYPCPEYDDTLFVDGSIIPDAAFAAEVASLSDGEAMVCGGELMAFRGSRAAFDSASYSAVREIPQPRMLRYVFDIFLLTGEVMREDFLRLTAGRTSEPLSESNRLFGPYRLPDGTPSLFIEKGAVVEGTILNLNDGPIYIGKDAQVMEGVCLRGNTAVCDHAKINMGAKIYGPTTIGPYCKVGGEINNVVMFGYSNKAHDGFLGNAVIGEWCNIGAGTNASNLKNDYSKIRIWNYRSRTFMRTQLQFCGLIMGDHSKAGINCMFNTATVMGVGVNVHGSGFPRVFLPGFTEGSPAGGFTNVPLRKFFDIAERVMARRSLLLSGADRRIFERIYEMASDFK